ncbi:MAG: four helix bundle protein [Crocinitomicaceae bacterium]
MSSTSQIQSHRDLKIWIKGIQLVKEIYKMCESLPKEEIYALQSQLKRSAVSIPSNIAEGYGRNYTKSYIQFLNIARGSLLELETQVTIAYELEFIESNQYERILVVIEEENKMINAFIKSVERHLN